MIAIPRRLLPCLTLLVLAGLVLPGSAQQGPVGDKEPLLRVEAGGPTATVMALAFSADGKTLYAAGRDKVIRVWTLNDKGLFVPDRIAAYRVPIGPGLSGAINALALSDDGVWLAAAGRAVVRDEAGGRLGGVVYPSSGTLTDEMREDLGTITLFNTRDQSVRLLRGHRGAVYGLAFAPLLPGKVALLLSLAQENATAGAKLSWAARLWDAERGKLLSARTDLLDVPAVPARPGLDVWWTGKNNTARAALSLSDGTFRVWTGGKRPTALWKAPDFKFTATAARLPGSNDVLTTTYGKGKARLRLWKLADNGEPKTAALKPQAGPDAFPRALGLLVRKAGGKPDLAAVIVRPGHEEQYRLQIVDLGSKPQGALVAERDLWNGKSRQPVLAAVPGGRHVAVAGNQENVIRVFSLDALLSGSKTPPQELRGIGTAFQHVSFVREGEDVGVLLNSQSRRKQGQQAPAPDAERGDQIFSFRQRAWAADPGKWKSDGPALGNWRVEVEGNDDALVVFDGKERVGRVRLDAVHRLSDYALLPPRGARKVPLLALATYDLEQSHLVLYDARSGKALRRFIGHVDPITGLAFSGDGRLLVSAAEDQTVRVWSLTDLDAVLGRLGKLEGVTVLGRSGTLVVERVDKDSPAAGKLATGDVVAGLMDGESLRPTTTPEAFYEAVLLLAPESNVRLRIDDPKGKRDVSLVVGQGQDERKPLLSLFVIPAGKGEESEWIGWHPLGSYDASSPKVERLLGWHFNTGDPKRPTRFVLAADYRKEQLQQGILEKLVKEGRLPPPVKAPKLNPPKIFLAVGAEGQTKPAKEGEPLVVRQPRVELKLEVRERPLGTLSSLTWKMDDGAEQTLALDRADGDPFTIPVELRRGDHRIVVTALTKDVPPQPTRETLTLRYQPPAPRLTYKGPRQVSLKQPTFDLRGLLVAPGLAGEEVRLIVKQRQGDKAVFSETTTHKIDPDKPLELKKTLKLALGNNLLEVVAVNKDAAAAQADAETARLTLEVFRIKEAAPPAITFLGIAPLGGDKAERQAIAEALTPLRVSVPKVRLEGKIKGEEKLLLAEVFAGDAARGASLTGFTTGQSAELAINQEIKLKPGKQTFRFRAKTATSDVAERVLTLEYRPALPVVRLDKLPREVVADKDLKETVILPLRGRITLPEDRQAYRLRLLVNDKEQAPPVIDERAGTVTASVILSGGDNRIRLALSNDWGATAQTDEVGVRYLRPPQMQQVKQKAVAGKPAVDLEVTVRSPLPLLPDSVKVEVNGRESPPARVRIDKGTEPGLHVLRLEGVLLDAGRKENVLRVSASNADAAAPQPASVTIGTASVLPPPVVEILDPKENRTVTQWRVKVRVRARSVSPLSKVQLMREGLPPVPIDVSKVKKDAEGRFQLTAEVDVDLEMGANALSLEAVNASGRGISALVVLNYLPAPLRVTLDRLVVKQSGGKGVEAERRPRGQVVFPAAAGGQVRLQGRILWGNEKVAAAQKNLLVRITVNGFQQIPIALKPASEGKLETPFEADLLLSREKDNQVRLSVLGQDASTLSEFTVDCAKPIKQQRLHLLVLGPRAKDAGALRKQVLDAVQAKAEEGGLRTPAFESVKVYGPLVGAQVRASAIVHKLLEIKYSILALTRTGAPGNDVLMVYYQGSEMVRKEGNFFETFSGAAEGGARQFGLPADDLVDLLSGIPGAQVLLLDVERNAQAEPAGQRDKIARWKDDYPAVAGHVAVLRHAWQGKTAAPREAQLLPALEQALTRAGRLDQVVTQMEKTVRGADLQVLRYLPADLQSLQLGAER